MALPNHRPPAQPQLTFAPKEIPIRFLMKSDGCIWEEFKVPESINTEPGSRWFKCVFSPRHTKERPSTILGKEVAWSKEHINQLNSFNSIELLDEVKYKTLTAVVSK